MWEEENRWKSEKKWKRGIGARKGNTQNIKRMVFFFSLSIFHFSPFFNSWILKSYGWVLLKATFIVVYSSATCVSTFMAPSSSKDATTKKGKRYKGIPTKHPYKKIHRSVTASEDRQQSLLTSQVWSTHAERSLDPISPVTVKREVPESLPPWSFHQSASSSVSRTQGLVETVVLDSDSSDSEDNVVLLTLL